MKPVAIVGGGWAGLACAVELAGAGIPVRLFEAARQLGGRARRVEWNGLPLDNGQHLMVGAYRKTLALMDRLGTTSLLERRNLELDLPGFRLALPRLPAPMHLAAGLAGARGLGPADKLAAVRLMNGLRACRFRLPEDLPADAFLARRRQPARLVERLWAPLCIAALNTPLENASAQVFCHVLRDSLAGPREASDLMFNRADLGRLLADPAADFLVRHGGHVHLGIKVKGIHSRPGGFFLAGPDQEAERVVLATHPNRLPDLLADLPELAGISQEAQALAWQPILTLWLRFAEPLNCPFPMLGLGGAQDPWVFERQDIAPGLAALVTSAQGPHLEVPNEQLKADYLALLTRRLGPLPPLLDWLRIVEKRATFACAPNLTRPGNATPLPGLFLAGDYTAGDYPATLEGAVGSGLQCAALVLGKL